MRRHYYLIGIILFFLIVCIVLFFTQFETYRLYTADEECAYYSEQCRCIGTLTIMESYPEQFDCSGFEFCKDIDETECKQY